MSRQTLSSKNLKRSAGLAIRHRFEQLVEWHLHAPSDRGAGHIWQHTWEHHPDAALLLLFVVVCLF